MHVLTQGRGTVREYERCRRQPLGPRWKERLTQPAGGRRGVGSEGDEQRTGNFTVGGRRGSEGPALGAWREEGKEAFQECGRARRGAGRKAERDLGRQCKRPLEASHL